MQLIEQLTNLPNPCIAVRKKKKEKYYYYTFEDKNRTDLYFNIS